MNQKTLSPERLTPREWEVLALVREGLTNEEIAARLGISRDGVKYHVSEVLGKLGVEDRIAAARWYDRETRGRVSLAGFFAGLFGRKSLPAPMALAAAAIGVVAVGLGALVLGVVLMEARGGGPVEPLPTERRTDDAQLDEMLAVLVNGESGAIESAAGGIQAQEFDPQSGARFLDPAEWAGVLASHPGRELYAVLTPQDGIVPPRDFEVHLRVTDADGAVQGWQIAVENYAIVDVMIGEDPVWLASRASFEPERFVLLPPAEDLPAPPVAHGLAERTGDAGVDALLGRVEDGDVAGLLDLVQYVEVPCGPDAAPFCDGAEAGTPVPALVVADCNGMVQQAPEADAEEWLTELVDGASGLHAVAAVPQGNIPAGQHLVIVFVQEGPYAWGTMALVERDGAVVGLVRGCNEQAEQIYPPLSFLAEPVADEAALTPDRRSGDPLIDAALDALTQGDAAALATLIDYEVVECVTQVMGIGSPPECLPGEAPGTEIEVFGMASCEGYYVRRTDIVESLNNVVIGDWALYAVADLGDTRPGISVVPGRLEAVVVDTSPTDRPRAMGLFFTDEGLRFILHGCGPSGAQGLLRPGRSPDFLLAPQ